VYRHGAEEELSRYVALEPIAAMGTFEVVEAQEAIQGFLELPPGCEVSAAEDHTPVLVQDGSLQTLDEAIGPAVAGFGSRVADGEALAGLVEVGLEFVAVIAEDALEFPARGAIAGQYDFAEEGAGGLCGRPRHDAGEGEGAGGITGSELPDRSHALELADVERVDADKFAWKLRLDMLGAAETSVEQILAGPFREQADGASAVMLDDTQALTTSAQPDPSQQPMDGARGQTDALTEQLVGQPLWTRGGPSEGQGNHVSLLFRRDLRGPTSVGPRSLRVQTIRTIGLEALPPSIEERSRDLELLTGLCYAPEFSRKLERTQPDALYAVGEGHYLSPRVACWETSSRKNRSMTLASSVPFRPRGVSTPFWDRTP